MEEVFKLIKCISDETFLAKIIHCNNKFSGYVLQVNDFPSPV